MAKETRTIRVGPKAALHIIQSQAGTLGKAILEYLMNSVDSGSSRADVSLTSEGVEIVDDGHGFDSRDSIESFFEVLCFDHGPESEDWRTYGRFGMGRAQLFSFASTDWRTRTFMMSVDIRNRGLDYDLEEGLPDEPGCRVTGRFYEPLSSSDIYQTSAELKEMALYCPIPVYLNGELITADPENEEWDYITDEAYIRLQPSGDMAVYNLGIFVRRYSGYFFGQGGVVVSRKELDVNFARNDVMQSRCPVWKKIAPMIKNETWEKASKKPTLNDAERQRIIADWVAGEKTFDEVKNLALIKWVTGRSSKVGTVFSFANRPPLALCSADKKRIGDTLHRRKLAAVLAPEMYEWFGLANSGAGHEEKEKSLTERLGALVPDRLKDTAALRPMAELSELVDSSYEVLDDKDLSKRDLAILKALRNISGPLAQYAHRMWELDFDTGREVRLGRSDSAVGWTDGENYIVIERRHARKVQQGLPGIGEVVHTMIHEQCHLTPSAGEHDHNQGFFERFHDLSDIQGELAQKLLRWLLSQFRQKGFKLNGKLMMAADLHQEAVGYSDTDDVEAIVAKAPASPRKSTGKKGRRSRAATPKPSGERSKQVDLFG